MSHPRCPTCKGPAAPRPANPAAPFCSERCRLVDLGKWLSEDFRIPVRHADDDDDGDASPGPSGAS